MGLTATATAPASTYTARPRVDPAPEQTSSPANVGATPDARSKSGPYVRFGLVAAAVLGGVAFLKFRKKPEAPAADGTKPEEKKFVHKHVKQAARAGSLGEQWETSAWYSKLGAIALTGLAALGVIALARQSRS